MLNKIILMGRLTRDPELRTTQSGVSVASFTLAVNRNFVRSGEERQADFIDIVAWRTTAEFCQKYFRKGQLVAVCGSLQTRKWEDKEGNRRTAYEVQADEVHFAERRQDNYGSPPHPAEGGFSPPSAKKQGDSPPFALETPSTFEEIEEDDGELPF